jgi:hypothetical protein
MYKMGSNNAKPISSEGSSESVGPPSAKVIPEPMTNPTTPSPKISSLTTQKNIKHSLDKEESDNEEPGGHHGVRHARKKYKTDGNGKFVIGHHCNEPRLRIFAMFRQDGAPYVCAIRENVTNPDIERQWDDLVPKNNIVNTEKVILDQEVFWAFGDVEGLNREKKLKLIKKYLTFKKEGTSMKDLGSSLKNATFKYSCDPAYLHVGYFKNNMEKVDKVEPVPVHAKVSYRGKVGAAVKFQVLESDG